MKIVAIVLAGGKGSRMNSSIPKQYMTLNGKPVLYYALEVFQNSVVDEIVLVTGAEEREYCRQQIVEPYHLTKVSKIVAGGAERFYSVMNGLSAIDDISAPQNSVYVLIHDGARPCVTQEIINRCIEDAKRYQACVVAVPVKDTIKVVDENGFATHTPDRSMLWQIQTPQAFEYSVVKKAYTSMIDDDNRGNITDDAMVVEKYSDTKVKMTMGAYTNIKITTQDDMRSVALTLQSCDN